MALRVSCRENFAMTTTPTTDFRVGILYSIDEIQSVLKVGNAGGVRISLGEHGAVRRAVILTSVPNARQGMENPYHDRIENDILVYTGAGREGNQTLGGVNSRLPQQLESNFPVYGFVLVANRRDTSTGPKRWRFLGLLEYVRHYPDTQADAGGTLRKVWLFELRIHGKPEAVVVTTDHEVSERVLIESRTATTQAIDDREIGESPLIIPRLGGEFDPIEIECIRGRLLATSPEQFEHLVKDLLVLSGFVNVTVTRFSGDGGVDAENHNAYEK